MVTPHLCFRDIPSIGPGCQGPAYFPLLSIISLQLSPTVLISLPSKPCLVFLNGVLFGGNKFASWVDDNTVHLVTHVEPINDDLPTSVNVCSNLTDAKIKEIHLVVPRSGLVRDCYWILHEWEKRLQSQIDWLVWQPLFCQCITYLNGAVGWYLFLNCLTVNPHLW